MPACPHAAPATWTTGRTAMLRVCQLIWSVLSLPKYHHALEQPSVVTVLLLPKILVWSWKIKVVAKLCCSQQKHPPNCSCTRHQQCSRDWICLILLSWQDADVCCSIPPFPPDQQDGLKGPQLQDKKGSSPRVFHQVLAEDCGSIF